MKVGKFLSVLTVKQILRATFNLLSNCIHNVFILTQTDGVFWSPGRGKSFSRSDEYWQRGLLTQQK